MRKTAVIMLVFQIMTVVSGCQKPNSEEQDLRHVKSIQDDNSPKVILLMADSLMASAIDEGIRQKQLPTFQFLIEHGQYYKDVVSSFPTMSVTVDSSLLTGKYADVHGVPGLIWYSSDKKRIINYGTGPMEVFRQDVDTVLTDALINLNGSHLNRKIPTIYEDLAHIGLKSGSINGLVYRGKNDHVLSIPEWIQVPTTLKRDIQVKGPDFLAFGALSNPLDGKVNLAQGLTNRMGMNNDFSVKSAKYLIQANKLPDFLFVYLPDLDRKLHQKGPSNLDGVKKLDGQVNNLLQSFGSPEQALKEVIFVILGDSGMTQLLPADQNPVIDLPVMFEGVNILRPGETATDQTEIVLAVNETMGYVYKLKPNRSLQNLADTLSRDERIDFIAWQEKNWIHVIQGGTAKRFKYKEKGNMIDCYKQSWTIEQDSGVLDLKVNADDGRLEYGAYPDALQRLASALHSHQGDFMVVTAKPGYELADSSSPTHKGGGGHGSIRQTESLVPLIITGTNRKPEYLRMVDLKSYLLKLLTQ
ncbi:phosphodiesterase [Paenibacillus stellifer]|uniref:Phosphodiesterase n=2 Tax=Paenibacillus stellifer TaxID=169760 RepID=A0A089N0I9_9BACL|nr:phosphodiesterase [Paenibacillus stellifer]